MSSFQVSLDAPNGVLDDEINHHLHALRHTVMLVEMALTDASDDDGNVIAPHVLAAVLFGTQHHIDALEQLTVHAYRTSEPKGGGA
ncbi:hypothetical protein EI168_02600 [Halomonas sp. FME1]|uniref:Uncharacterized protein n=1 Tax=Halomonas casei TaxID=2742613 RepID=A0ABR9EXQ4_9GAMM|nr:MULTISPECIES: hypothetical protein [Halomonas]MBE0398998.1 hypothetical protein [Halomonas casei]PCC23016.1 hypothetical protein CIK78_13645 [Halomonas sp. JB37]